MKSISSDDFRVKPGKKVNVAKLPTLAKPLYRSSDDYSEKIAVHAAALSKLQQLLYASNRYSLLLILQAMDAAGKDGVIKHVMSGINPQGCQVYSFTHPSAEELDHDFLWSAMRRLPERGRIGIFNRSYYEEVLIVRVHPEILHAEAMPPELVNPKNIWEERYQSIRHLETHLARNGTKVVKVFLNLSKEEQRKRLLERIDEPSKNWKANPGDLIERNCWKQYMEAYSDCLSATSSRHAPWYVVPADDKANARLIVSQILVDTLQQLPMRYPELDAPRLAELKAMRKALAKP